MRITVPALAFVTLTLSGCNAESPTREAEAAFVGLTYVPSKAPVDCTAPSVAQCYGFCYHSGAPANLTVSTSWDERARLEACDGGFCTILTRVPVGRDVAIRVYDVGQCCRDCSTAVRETVFANGTRLARYGAGGLTFSVNGRGIVTP